MRTSGTPRRCFEQLESPLELFEAPAQVEATPALPARVEGEELSAAEQVESSLLSSKTPGNLASEAEEEAEDMSLVNSWGGLWSVAGYVFWWGVSNNQRLACASVAGGISVGSNFDVV